VLRDIGGREGTGFAGIWENGGVNRRGVGTLDRGHNKAIPSGGRVRSGVGRRCQGRESRHKDLENREPDDIRVREPRSESLVRAKRGGETNDEPRIGRRGGGILGYVTKDKRSAGGQFVEAALPSWRVFWEKAELGTGRG